MKGRKKTSEFRLLRHVVVLLAVVSSGVSQGTVAACRLDLRKIARLEQKLMRLLRPRLDDHFHPSLNPKPEELARLDRRARNVLSRQGVRFQKADESVKPFLDEELSKRQRKRLGFTGRVYRVLSLPVERLGSPHSPVWDHPEAQAILDHLKDIGVELLVDSTMVLTRTIGVFEVDDSRHPPRTWIRVTPDCDLVTLKHEVQHADYFHYGFDRILQTYLSFASPEEAKRFLDDQASQLPDNVARRLRRAVGLLTEGYPIGAINERLSGDQDLETLRTAGVAPDDEDFLWAKAYPDFHLLTELAEVARARPLNEAERRCLVGALDRYMDVSDIPMSSPLGKVYREYQDSLDGTKPPPPRSLGASLLSLLPRWGFRGVR